METTTQKHKNKRTRYIPYLFHFTQIICMHRIPFEKTVETSHQTANSNATMLLCVFSVTYSINEMVEYSMDFFKIINKGHIRLGLMANARWDALQAC